MSFPRIGPRSKKSISNARTFVVWVLVFPGLGFGSARMLCQELGTPEEKAPRYSDPGAMRYFGNVWTIVDWSDKELNHALPGLKGLEPAANQEELPRILQKVGENVEEMYRDFLNTTSVERIRQVRMGLDEVTEQSRDQHFNYLMLAKTEENMVGLEEYRTNRKGVRVEPQPLSGGSVITKGFASISKGFLLRYQPDSRFRLLGRQKVQGVRTYVVAYAQIPVKAHLVGAFECEEGRALLLNQGVAWVDPVSYRILHYRSDLLAPRPDIYLERETTEVQFAEVRFKNVPAVFWLPREVVVTVQRKGQIYRNRHWYSGFKLFDVETEGKVEAPRAGHVH